MGIFSFNDNIHDKAIIPFLQKMRKIIFALLVLSLLILSGCNEITGRGITDDSKDNKIDECVNICNDNSKTEEEFLTSCTQILQYGGEKVFNDYVESCKK